MHIIILPNVFRLPKIKCKYSNNGCAFEQILSAENQALDDHQAECQDRTVACIYLRCPKTVALSKLSVHLKNEHPLIVPKVNTSFAGTLAIKPDVFNSQSIWTWVIEKIFLEKRFYFVQSRDSSNGLFYLWVYVIGTQKEERNFTYTFTLYNADKVNC